MIHTVFHNVAKFRSCIRDVIGYTVIVVESSDFRGVRLPERQQHGPSRDGHGLVDALDRRFEEPRGCQSRPRRCAAALEAADAIAKGLCDEAAAAAAPVVVNVEGADVTINVEGNHKYICGELTSLKIGTVEKSARTSAIFFTSGATATELTWSDDLVDIIGYKTPAPNKAYEINIEELRAIIE